jgi:putative ABC transport system substrate-binding protein
LVEKIACRAAPLIRFAHSKSGLTMNMKRRNVLTLVAGFTLLRPLLARAQQSPRPRVVAVLFSSGSHTPESDERAEAFRQGLTALGWTEGRDVGFVYRYTGDDPELARELSAELVALKPDVIFSSGTVTTTALKETTQAIPIVFVNVTDPVAGGFVASLSHPGGN